MLSALGVSETAEQVYVAMLAQPDLGVEGLAAQLDLTEAQVGEALDDLFALSLVRESFDRPGRLRALEPEIGLQAALARQHEELVRRQQQVAAGQAAVARMLAEHARAAPRPAGDSGVEHLIGMDAVQGRLERFSRDTESEVLTFMPGGAQSASALEAACENDARLLARGVSICTVGQDSIRNHAPTLAYAQFLADHHAEFRTAPMLPPRMIVIDRRSALVPLDPADTRKGALHLTAPGTVAVLLALFEQVWETAVPLGADRTPDRESLTAIERGLLTLLARGLTDEAAAARLAVSPRTARRLMAELMERLGATSRFEAGLKAARSGWLP
ncbi:helix-turn-helix transcriptional regulator [Actinospica robiniae]|uniref:helix-turn-helix transcriptional regulator n=1 Tax=Actinospica robiniae TaxID=304901 RepID=UPI00054EE897|nr:LuxR family transcriptional regulator [Actinospica robiniae]